jgi:hypothetical protein
MSVDYTRWPIRLLDRESADYFRGQVLPRGAFSELPLATGRRKPEPGTLAANQFYPFKDASPISPLDSPPVNRQKSTSLRCEGRGRRNDCLGGFRVAIHEDPKDLLNNWPPDLAGRGVTLALNQEPNFCLSLPYGRDVKAAIPCLWSQLHLITKALEYMCDEFFESSGRQSI